MFVNRRRSIELELPNQIVIEAAKGWWNLQLRSIWQYRELLFLLAWRDVKVRYKQTVLGVAWVVLQPLVSMLIFTLLFGVLLNVPSGDTPYPIFTFTALLAWNYFAGSLTKASQSVVQNTSLVTKIYFPRLIIPLSGVLSGLVDFAISFVLLLGLMAIYRQPLRSGLLLLPVFLLLAMLTSLGFGLWLSALNVRFRDVNFLLPFLVQVWMYATPVIYGVDLLPVEWRWLLALNPLTGVVEGFRWAVLGQAGLFSLGWLFWLSTGIALVVLVSGLAFFRRTERTFADII
jgi:lipopolysaccharide transport system permease protein